MNAGEDSFYCGLFGFGLNGLLLILAAHVVFVRQQLVTSRSLRYLFLPLLALGKTFFLVGLSYWVIDVLKLPALYYVSGALVSLLLIGGACFYAYSRSNL